MLCSDDCGNPIGSANKQIYSTCDNGVLSRRDLTSGGSSNPRHRRRHRRVDDMALMSGKFNLGERAPWRPNATSCPADMGTPDGGGLFGGTNGSGRLGGLNPDYICTDQIGAERHRHAHRSLVNGQVYHFLVLSVDAYGNATASSLIDGSPQPTEDLWRRYRDEGGGPGGCFIATAAFGSYENRWVWVLRDFRDQVLLEHDSGRAFVEWYYAHSPARRGWIAEHGVARIGTRILLWPVIAAAWSGSTPPLQKALVLTLLLAFLLRKRIRRAVRGRRRVKRARLARPLVALAARRAGPRRRKLRRLEPPRFGENPPRSYESSQRFAVELKFGPYSPNIDASPGLNGSTFADLFPPDNGTDAPARSPA